MSDVSDWWATEIIDMAPGQIRLRGQPIEQMIGRTGFAQMIWHMVMGTELSAERVALFEAALVAAVDHGPQAPSIATARMAVTCGVPLNGAMASAVNMLGDVHGGAGEQAAVLYEAIFQNPGEMAAVLDAWRSDHGPYVPGFGHRFHKPVDPRAPRLMDLVAKAKSGGAVSGAYAEIAMSLGAHLSAEKGKPIPMNIDGATAAIYCELGVPAPLSRGFFCLSRSVGILAHAWEQQCQGGRNKGPTPPGYRWTYEGPQPIEE